MDEVARRSGPWDLIRRQVRDVLHGILGVITDGMAEGNAVTIAGLGRFEVKDHKGRCAVGLDRLTSGWAWPVGQYDKSCRRWYNARNLDARSQPIGWILKAF